mgnify:CR=1 FL=1
MIGILEQLKNQSLSISYTPPLDIYSNSIAAFSVRKLRTAYEGPCMQIKNSSLTLIDVYFNSTGYLDISAIPSGTWKVNKWYDQSGNGNDVYNNDYSASPNIKVSGVVPIINGKAAVEYFTGGTGASVYLRFISKIQVESLLAVCNAANFGIVNYIGYSGADTDGFFLGGTFSGVNGFGVLKSGSIVVQNNSENTNQRLQSYYGGSTDRVYSDGANEAIRSSPFAAPFVLELGRTIANGGGINASNTGGIQEWIAFSDDKFSDKSGIEANMNSYFNVY